MAPGTASLVRKRVAGYLEQPDSEAAARRLGLLMKQTQARQSLQEDLCGHILGGVRVAELVEREAVHLGDVLPIKRFECARIAPRRYYGRAVGVEVDQDRLVLVLPSPQHRGSLVVTPIFPASSRSSALGSMRRCVDTRGSWRTAIAGNVSRIAPT